MADLSCNVAGIKAPNPFWLASAPPTDKLYNVVLDLNPPIVYSAYALGASRFFHFPVT